MDEVLNSYKHWYTMYAELSKKTGEMRNSIKSGWVRVYAPFI